MVPSTVLHWNYRGFTEFPLSQLQGEESDITDIYLKENLISRLPKDIDKLQRLESLYLSGNDITELPKEIAGLRQLKCLDVSGNRLRSIPEEIGEVRSLKYLILDDNDIRELPLRLSELRGLQYLSVCDNKLKWLPQRPVYNYFHCEFRFWRNDELRTVPYSLWYHMLRDQQTRSLNIGCLKVPQLSMQLPNGRCRLKFQNSSRTWEADVEIPHYYSNILERGMNSPPTLLELTKRRLYEILYETAKSISDDNFSIYSNNIFYNETEGDENNNLTEEFNDLGITTHQTTNALPSPFGVCKNSRKFYSVPSDLIEEYFNFLPKFLKEELCRGPVSRCESVQCRKPIFDFVTYEFCFGKIVLIYDSEDVILSAAFCSQKCANVWNGGKTNAIIPWRLTP